MEDIKLCITFAFSDLKMNLRYSDVKGTQIRLSVL